MTVFAVDAGAAEPAYAGRLGLNGTTIRLSRSRFRGPGVPLILVVDENRSLLASFPGVPGATLADDLDKLITVSRTR